MKASRSACNMASRALSDVIYTFLTQSRTASSEELYSPFRTIFTIELCMNGGTLTEITFSSCFVSSALVLLVPSISSMNARKATLARLERFEYSGCLSMKSSRSSRSSVSKRSDILSPSKVSPPVCSGCKRK